MILSIGLPLILFYFVLRAILRRVTSRSISHLPGPPPGPWLVGNLPEILRPDNVAEAEFEWVNKYGTAVRIKGAYGIDVLFTADPKVRRYILPRLTDASNEYDNDQAMQYVFSSAGFTKSQQSIATQSLVTGPSILVAQGALHAKHRKIMSPAFSYTALRGFLPIFHRIAQRTVAKWKETMPQTSPSAMVVDIPSWLSRTTLDAIGLAAFDHDFGAINESNNELFLAYNNLVADTFFKRSDFAIAFEALWGYLPMGTVNAMKLLPSKQLTRFRKYATVAQRVAKNIVDTQTESYSLGKEGGKDVMSILIRANLSEDPKKKLSDIEVTGQLQTLMLAAQDNTASTLTWAFYELSRNLEFQNRVREEIKTTRAEAAGRGSTELTIADLDSMYTVIAVIKETLRYHPAGTILTREACREEVIPLSSPVTTKTGEVITSVPVTKGQRVLASIAAYHRLPSVWGEDAHVWRPERFLEGIESKQKTGLGVVANIATFGSGTRSCPGWRFAILSMQAVFIAFLEEFEFSPAPGNPEIIKSATQVISPMIKDQPGRVQLPLTIRSLR